MAPPAVIISADEIKKTLKGYDPKKSELFHRDSAKEADKIFKQELKNSSYSQVILLSGGTAAGKTEFISSHLVELQDTLIVDTTLPTIEGAKIKIENIDKTKKTPVIYAVIPNDLERAFSAFLNRERQFSEKYFYKTHSTSRATLLWIAETYPDIEIHVFESGNLYGEKMRFYEFKFDNRYHLLEFLKHSQYSEQEIIDLTS